MEYLEDFQCRVTAYLLCNICTYPDFGQAFRSNNTQKTLSSGFTQHIIFNPELQLWSLIKQCPVCWMTVYKEKKEPENIAIIGLLRVKCVQSSLHYRVPISAASDLLWEALCLNLMNHTIDAIVQQLLVVVVQGGVHLIISQPGILPDLLQGVVLHQDTIFKNSHQQILKKTEKGYIGKCILR